MSKEQKQTNSSPSFLIGFKPPYDDSDLDKKSLMRLFKDPKDRSCKRSCRLKETAYKSKKRSCTIPFGF